MQFISLCSNNNAEKYGKRIFLLQFLSTYAPRIRIICVFHVCPSAIAQKAAKYAALQAILGPGGGRGK